MSLLVFCECGHTSDDHEGDVGLCLDTEDGMLCDCEGFDPEDV